MSNIEFTLTEKECRCCGEKTFNPVGTALISKFFEICGLHIISNTNNYMTIGFCKNCTFVSTWPEISDDSLKDYYNSYLSDAYKKIRCSVEPDYVAIAHLHGCQEELLMRKKSYADFILPVLKSHFNGNINLLDYGGDSTITPDESFIKKNSFIYKENSKILEKFDFIQNLHVLEHVGNPRQILKKIILHLKVNGLLYIEVPWEYNELMKNGTLSSISEHINKFNDISLTKMCESLNLEVLLCKEDFIEQKHINRARVIRCICKYNGLVS